MGAQDHLGVSGRSRRRAIGLGQSPPEEGNYARAKKLHFVTAEHTGKTHMRPVKRQVIASEAFSLGLFLLAPSASLRPSLTFGVFRHDP
jgi:hypothetical protein